MVTVAQILQAKGTEIFSVPPEVTVYQALQEMADRRVGALLVMQGDELVGIFSERDYARKIALEGRSSTETIVSEVMTKEVICVNPHQQTVECMEMMTNGRFRHIPVKDNGKVVGLISIGDVVKAIISDLEFTIQQLENYITGNRQ